MLSGCSIPGCARTTSTIHLGSSPRRGPPQPHPSHPGFMRMEALGDALRRDGYAVARGLLTAAEVSALAAAAKQCAPDQRLRQQYNQSDDPHRYEYLLRRFRPPSVSVCALRGPHLPSRRLVRAHQTLTRPIGGARGYRRRRRARRRGNPTTKATVRQPPSCVPRLHPSRINTPSPRRKGLCAAEGDAAALQPCPMPSHVVSSVSTALLHPARCGCSLRESRRRLGGSWSGDRGSQEREREATHGGETTIHTVQLATPLELSAALLTASGQAADDGAVGWLEGAGLHGHLSRAALSSSPLSSLRRVVCVSLGHRQRPGCRCEVTLRYGALTKRARGLGRPHAAAGPARDGASAAERGVQEDASASASAAMPPSLVSLVAALCPELAPAECFAIVSEP